jgi:ankyrin repeat protein
MKYTFKFHYIETNEALTDKDKKVLAYILQYFPSATNSDHWRKAFNDFNSSGYDARLLKLAANAFDSLGNTVLGYVADTGDAQLVKAIIDLGADLDTIDHHSNKLALHWAISNYESSKDKNCSIAAGVVKVLLDAGACIDIECYQKQTPRQYAESRGYTAAVQYIDEAIEQRNKANPSISTRLEALKSQLNLVQIELYLLQTQDLKGDVPHEQRAALIYLESIAHDIARRASNVRQEHVYPAAKKEATKP